MTKDFSENFVPTMPPVHKTRIGLLIGCQALLCWLDVYLISKISWIGKIGIATVHKEYRLLRSDWKTFLLLFSLQVILIIILAVIRTRPQKISTLVTSLLLMLGAVGLFLTFRDFIYTYTHRLLKERFHLGFYLFWIGWIGNCIFFLALKEQKDLASFPLDPNTPTIEESIV
jgi:hypothetical protein